MQGTQKDARCQIDSGWGRAYLAQGECTHAPEASRRVLGEEQARQRGRMTTALR